MSDQQKIHKAKAYRPACRRCHARKVKCDLSPGKSCTNCITAGTECVTHEKRPRNGGSARERRTMPRLLPNRPENSPMMDSDPVDQVVQTPIPVIETSPLSTGPTYTSDDVDQAAATLSSMQDAGVSGAKRHLVELLSQEDIDRRVMQKGVRVVYVGQEFSNLNYLIRHKARNESSYHFPTNQISRKYISHDLDQIPKEAFSLPSPAVVDELLAQYFQRVNPMFPILDEKTFMSQFRGRDPQNPPSLLVLQAALMVGAHVSQSRRDRDELKAAFFRRAKMLFDARYEWNRDIVVQAALLLTWHSEGFEDVGANSYHWVGVAVRTALGLGMHRDCGPSTLVSHDKRLWRRLWWILVQFDVLVTLSYGRPQAINLDDADVPKLETSDFDGLEMTVDMDFVIHHSNLCRIMSHVIRERFGLSTSAERRRTALLKADQDLAAWIMNLPQRMQSSLPGRVQTISSAMLHISYNNMLILLHRPPPTPKMKESVMKSDDIEICSSASATMMGFFETLWRQDQLCYLNVFSVNAIFTAMIQLSAEMRIANPVLATTAMRRFDTALEVLRSLSEYWLNAELILRLFEESSERLQQVLRIGKATGKHPSVNNDETENSLAFESGISMSDHALSMATDWSRFMSQSSSTLVSANQFNDQSEWSNIYWENSGFPSLSPYNETAFQNII